MEGSKAMVPEYVLRLGDCLEIMPKLSAGLVNLILCDLPYGTTQNKWDSILPLALLWKEYGRIAKSNAGKRSRIFQDRKRSN